MDYFDEDFTTGLGEDLESNLSAVSVMEAPPISIEIREPQQSSNRCNSAATLENMPNHHNQPIILTFGNPSTPEINPQPLNLEDDRVVSEVLTSHGSFVNLEEEAQNARKKKKTGGRVRPALQIHDHILAERKHREQLSQGFVALSAIVPGLKKMDKTSVLGDAIIYLKHLQERVKTLEEQVAQQTMQSVVLVKRSQLLVEDEGSSDDTGGPDEQPLPEIEAKMRNRNILLRIHCEKHKGVLVQILSEVEKHNLAVMNTCVAPFGNLALDITIITEMEKEFSLTIQELVKILGSALHRGTVAD
ncbi:transcription factor NAI1 [Coffea arabica]|uniref:Transcription factor NAI1 n=1 Tax=Coffea arabica TaxID=13443 RepID=A0A6P6WJH5_COFAR|nr:transcription factor NAI1-like [Coffea arabica]